MEDPAGIYTYRIAEVIRRIELGDNNYSIIVQINSVSGQSHEEPFITATYKIEVDPGIEDDKEFNVPRLHPRRHVAHVSPAGDPPKELNTLREFSGMLISYSATNLPINREKQELLSINDEKSRPTAC